MVSWIQRTRLWTSGLVLIPNGLLMVWLVVIPRSQSQFYLGLDALMAGGQLLTAGLAFDAFVTLRKRGMSLSRMPLLLTLGVLSTFLAQMINVYYDVHQGQVPYPSIADFFYLGAYPWYVWGILMFPVSRLSPTARARRAADGLLMILTLGTLCWHFVLGPTLVQSEGTLAEQLTSLAYPSADLLLLCCAVVLYTKGSSVRRDLLFPLILLTSGILCLAITDSLDGFFNLNNLPTSPYEFLGWSTGYLLIGLAMWRVKTSDQGELATVIEHSSWKQSLLPYSLVAAIVPLMIATWRTGSTGEVASGTMLGCLSVIGFVLLRQILALRTVHEANARLEAMSTTDPLTELPNHRAVVGRLEKEVELAHRHGRPFALLFFDGDHFKRVNDIYGHRAGDAVLQELGQRVQGLLRAGDTVGRYGGEEFLVLLPETALEEACEIAERLCKGIAQHPLATEMIAEGIPTTISVGVALFPTDGSTVAELVEQADQAMYWAKRLGRNQVRTAKEVERLSAEKSLIATIANLDRDTELPLTG